MEPEQRPATRDDVMERYGRLSMLRGIVAVAEYLVENGMQDAGRYVLHHEDRILAMIEERDARRLAAKQEGNQ